MKTAKEFLESKPLTLKKDVFDGYKVTYSYLVSLLEEYAQIKVDELNKSDVKKLVCICEEKDPIHQGGENYTCGKCHLDIK